MGIIVGVSLLGFLLAAKLHGVALRREREARGILQVSFRGGNPPFVEALWRAERWRFWGLSVVLAVGAWLALRAPGWMVATACLLWAPTVSFLVTGAMSWRRRGFASSLESR